MKYPLTRVVVFNALSAGDHLFGIGPLLAGCLNGMGGMVEGIEDKRLRAEAIQELDVRLKSFF